MNDDDTRDDKMADRPDVAEMVDMGMARGRASSFSRFAWKRPW